MRSIVNSIILYYVPIRIVLLANIFYETLIISDDTNTFLERHCSVTNNEHFYYTIYFEYSVQSHRVHKDNFNLCSGILNFQGLEYTTKSRKRIDGIYCEKYVNDYNNNNQFGAVRSNSKVKFSFSKVLLFRLLIVRRR